jgi:hypothetical protein
MESMYRRFVIQDGPDIYVKPYLKNRAEGIAQVAECLPSKSKALSSVPPKNKQK